MEILSWLDDHSRYLIGRSAHWPVTADAVVASFRSVVEEHGPPASTLTDGMS